MTYHILITQVSKYEEDLYCKTKVIIILLTKLTYNATTWHTLATWVSNEGILAVQACLLTPLFITPSCSLSHATALAPHPPPPVPPILWTDTPPKPGHATRSHFCSLLACANAQTVQLRSNSLGWSIDRPIAMDGTSLGPPDGKHFP